MKNGSDPFPSPKQSWKQTTPQAVWDSLDPAMGSSDHPVFADEGAPTEMKAGAVLGRMRSKVRAPAQQHTRTLEPELMCPESLAHLQGHLPGPGARNSILSIDDPGQPGQHGLDGRDSTAWEDRGSSPTH